MATQATSRGICRTTLSPDTQKIRHPEITSPFHSLILQNIWNHYSRPWSINGTQLDKFLVTMRMKAPSSWQSLCPRSIPPLPRWTYSNHLPSKAQKSAPRNQAGLFHQITHSFPYQRYHKFLMALTPERLSCTSLAANTIVPLQLAT